LDEGNEARTANEVVLQEQRGNASAEHGRGLLYGKSRNEFDSVFQSSAQRTRGVGARKDPAPTQVQGPEAAIAGPAVKVCCATTVPAPFGCALLVREAVGGNSSGRGLWGRQRRRGCGDAGIQYDPHRQHPAASPEAAAGSAVISSGW